MFTLVCLVAVGIALLFHEYTAARSLPVAGKSWSRRVALLLLVAAAVALGNRSQLASAIEDRLGSLGTPDVPFTRSGDPLFDKALALQRPARPFPSSGSTDDMRAWRDEVVNAIRLKSGAGDSAGRPIRIETQSTEQVGDVRRTLIRFTSWDGTAIPAYITAPRGEGRMPGILVIPGHGDGIRTTAGLARQDYQHANAFELARLGYVTLTPELRGFGMLTSAGTSTHSIVAHMALAAGSFYKAVVARDLVIALTVLQQQPEVDPARLAVAGASLGAELAVFLGAIDERPRVIISHSYGGNVGPARGEWAPDAGGQQLHGCHLIPGINQLLWEEDWFRLLAPRAVQVIRGTRNAPEAEAFEAFRTAAPEPYRASNAADRLEIGLSPGGHEFFLEPAVRFLQKWL